MEHGANDEQGNVHDVKVISLDVLEHVSSRIKVTMAVTIVVVN